MPKSRRKPLSKNKQKGSALNSPFPQGKDAQAVSTKIRPLLETLTSYENEAKSSALSEITLLCDDPYYRTLFLKERLLKIVLEVLFKVENDSNNLSAEAYGLLRNICVEEGYDTSVFLWRQGILEYTRKWLERESNLSSDLLENIIGLLSTMATTSNEVFDDIQVKLGETLSQNLVSIIQQAKEPQISSSLFLVACEAIYVFSDDNEKFLNQISHLDLPTILKSCNEYPSLGLVYLNGLKYNSIYSTLKNSSEKLDRFAQNIFEIVQFIGSFLSKTDLDNLTNDDNLNIDIKSPENMISIQNKILKKRSIQEGVQISIEIITAIMETISIDQKTQDSIASQYSDETNNDNIGDDDSDDSHLYIKNDISIPDEPISPNGILSQSNVSLEPTLNFIQTNIVSKLISTMSFSKFRSRSLAALNNIAWAFVTYSIYAKQWKKESEEIWSNLLIHVASCEEQPFVEIESINSAIGTLWAIATFYNSSVPITSGQIDYLISQSTTISELYPIDEATEHYIRLIGFFSVIAKASGQHQITQKISDYFIEILKCFTSEKGTDLPKGVNEQVIINILYGIFDIFGDGSNDYDKLVYVQGGMNDTLERLLPRIRNLFKRINKVNDFLLRERAIEAAFNLTRFIEYKSSEKEL